MFLQSCSALILLCLHEQACIRNGSNHICQAPRKSTRLWSQFDIVSKLRKDDVTWCFPAQKDFSSINIRRRRSCCKMADLFSSVIWYIRSGDLWKIQGSRRLHCTRSVGYRMQKHMRKLRHGSWLHTPLSRPTSNTIQFSFIHPWKDTRVGRLYKQLI